MPATDAQDQWIKEVSGGVFDPLDGAATQAGADAAAAGPDACDDADLPQPMLPDCQIVRGVVPAPDNFVLCAMHGHILDTDTRQIVAHNLKEFEARHPEFGKLPMPMLADCTPVAGRIAGPADHLLCGTHGHVLDIKRREIIAYSPKDYAKRFPPKPAAPPAAPAKAAAPAFDKAHAVDSLVHVLNGTSMLIADFQSRRGDAASYLNETAAGSCGDQARAVLGALADIDGPMHAFTTAAGEYVADATIAPPTSIPQTSQNLGEAFGKFTAATKSLKDCTDHPPARPPPPEPPDDVENKEAWKAQVDLLARRDRLVSARERLTRDQFLLPMGELAEKIQSELETAHDVARAVLAG